VYAAAKDLVRSLKPGLTDEALKNLSPILILAFDEAHQLTNIQGSAKKPWSRFDQLRRNIRKLKPLPIFSLFISTVSKISDFTTSPQQDLSMRIGNGALTLLPPFTELGFDQLLKKSPIEENTVTIQNAATVQFMCQFGRPLFVIPFYSLLFFY
jgi:hypothetical protein